jgi:hypothetical protein
VTIPLAWRADGGGAAGYRRGPLTPRPGLAMLERLLERVIFGSRWLLAPFYLGLIVALAATMVKFLRSSPASRRASWS